MIICACEDDDPDLPRISTTVSVTDPVIHYSGDKRRCTTYQIVLQSNDYCFSCSKSVVRRSFSEFLFLRRLLKQLHPTLNPPSLPSDSFFRDQFTEEFIEQRRQLLELFMLKILNESLYLSNKALHLFLQSHLSMKEIESIVSGNSCCPPGKLEESAIFVDSCASDISSNISECPSCDSLDASVSHSSSNKQVALLSINQEAFVASLPFLDCNTNIHITKARHSKS
ncbi:sorting nexin-10-like [Centruroides vittatus]|uniref:sorting nexin-10-like n=1 Tax=Centruroides vittatus TaxID=120091 RepID=UPI0035106A65